MEELTSALWTATLNGEYDLATQLICNGANVNEPINTDYDPVTTLLHNATHASAYKPRCELQRA